MTKNEHEVESDLIDLGDANVETKGNSQIDDFDGAVYQKRPLGGLSND